MPENNKKPVSGVSLVDGKVEEHIFNDNNNKQRIYTKRIIVLIKANWR